MSERSLRNLRDGQTLRFLHKGTLLGTAFVASSFTSRRRGLLAGAPPGCDACLLVPCRWIHTLGMKAPIRVLYLDASGKVYDDAGVCEPGRFFAPRLGATVVLELLPEAPGFAAAETIAGTPLIWEHHAE